MSAAVSVEGLSKRYRIGEPRPDTLRLQIADWGRALTRRPRGTTARDLWALRDVSFDVAEGEVVAIVGPNGGGKSTALKILSRVTEPTAGRAVVRGRLGGLLEVGTGFHGELTGRENVFLNAAILGMKRAEIARRFDEIVAFAGVEPFIDTAVKRYSSGMYVRLAFAVAAHLDPEVLVVDEVLAVGDAGFQRQCFAKIVSLARQGRTVLFVSHDMTTVASLARRAVFLAGGRVRAVGPVREVVHSYLQSVVAATERGRRPLETPASAPLAITAIATGDDAGDAATIPRCRPVVVTLDGEVRRGAPDARYFVALDVLNDANATLFRTQAAAGVVPREPGAFRLRCVLPAELFGPGTYRINLLTGITGHGFLQDVYPALEFDVVRDASEDVWSSVEGVLTLPAAWKVDFTGGPAPAG